MQQFTSAQPSGSSYLWSPDGLRRGTANHVHDEAEDRGVAGDGGALAVDTNRSRVLSAPAPIPSRARVAQELGVEVNGLRAKVTLARSKFAVGQPIEVAYAVKNVSKVEQVLWHSGFWPNHQILVRDVAGKEPPLTLMGQQGRDAFAPGGGRGKNVPWKVEPGKEDATEGACDLTKLYDLTRPGRYTVQYVYEERQAGGWQGHLPSNEAEFEIQLVEK